MTDEITWGSADTLHQTGSKRSRRIDWKETAKIVFFLADEFIIVVVILYLIYKAVG